MKSNDAVKSADTLKSAASMGSATLVSRFLGLAREQMVAILFGAGHFTDAFNIAFRIPNLLRDLLAEGAMSSAFVPVLSEVRNKRSEGEAWKLIRTVFWSLFWFSSLLVTVAFFYSNELVELFASSYHAEPGKFELTVQMTRILLPFFPAVVLAAAFMGVLNSYHVFFIPALAPAMFNVVSIVGCVALYPWFKKSGAPTIYALAWATLAGGLIQALFQLPKVFRLGYNRHQGTLKIRSDAAVRRILLLMVPSTVGLAATQINVLINSIVSTRMGEGAVSHLSFAFRLLQFPIGVIGVSFGVATLSKFSQSIAQNDFPLAKEQVTTSLKWTTVLNAFATAALIGLSEPIVSLLFGYGKFSAHDIQETSRALMAYSVGLLAYSLVKVLVPCCYALNRIQIAVGSSMISVGLTAFFNLRYAETFGTWGLALGTSMALIGNSAFLLVALKEWFHFKSWLWILCKSSFAAAIVGWICLQSSQLFVEQQLLRSVFEIQLVIPVWYKFLWLGTSGILGLFSALLLSHFLGLEEFSQFFFKFLKKFSKKH